MISYKRFWVLLDERGVSTYMLIKQGISSATIDRLRHNKGVNTQTLDDLCQLLRCKIEDIVEIVLDDKDKEL